jgi:ATP-binding cassette subfamily B protein
VLTGPAGSAESPELSQCAETPNEGASDQGRSADHAARHEVFEDWGGNDSAADEEAADEPPRISWRQVLRRFWPLTRGRRGAMAAALVVFCLAALGDAVGIDMLSQLIDGALKHGSLSEYWQPAALWAVITLGAATCTYAGSVLTASAAERFDVTLRARTYEHLLTLSPESLDRQPLGDLLSRVVDDVEDVEHLVVTGLIDAAACAGAAAIFGTAALLLSWDLALIVLAATPIVWLLNRWLTERTRIISLRTRVAHGALTSALEQGLTNSALVQAYNGQRTERRRLAGSSLALMRARLQQNRLAAVQGPLSEVIETIGLLAVLAIGVIDIGAGRLTIGGLLAFTAYLTFLYPPITALGQLGLVASTAGSSAGRLAQLLDLEPAVHDRIRSTDQSNLLPMSAVPQAPRGEIIIDRVSVTGADGRDRVRDVSFRVRPGELLMITGPSGSGKSTLVELLVRFRDPTSGRILLDGAELGSYSLQRLRQIVTLLPQEPFMFDDSVRENLVYGAQGNDPGTGVIRTVTRATGAEEFLELLPNGWRTKVGQRGRSLSGGQRQRIALSRALLRTGRVLVLDEPTTGLDPVAAEQLIRTLRAEMAGRAIVMVTHDLTLTRFADRVLELRNGRMQNYGAPPTVPIRRR